MHYIPGIAAALAVTAFSPAQAITAQTTSFQLAYEVSETFLVDGSASSLFVGDMGTLTATVPTGAINAFGLSEFDPSLGLTVSFDIFGQTFTEVDDDFYPFNPFLRLLDGQPNYFEMTVSEISGCCGGNPTDILDPRVLTFEIIGGDFFDEQTVISSLDVTATVVPLPAPLALLLGGIGALGFVGAARKRA